MLLSIAVYLVMAALLLVGLRRRLPDAAHPYPTADGNALRGFFALTILIGHCVRYSGGLLYPLGKFMIVAVSFYFFMSGYGLARGYARRPGTYLRRFLPRKGGALLILAGAAYLWRMLLSALTASVLPGTIFQYNFFTATNWYIWIQLYYYLVFYLVYRFVPRRRCLAVAVPVLLQCLVCYGAGLPMAWYASAVGFPLGVLFWEKAHTMDTLLHKPRGVALTALLLVAGAASQLYLANNLVDLFVLRNALCAAALLLLYQLLCRVTPGNRALRLLARYSAELYVFQFTYLDLFARLPTYPWRILAVTAATLVTALILHPVIARLKALLPAADSC